MFNSYLNDKLPLLYAALSSWNIITAVNALVSGKHLHALLFKALSGVEVHSVLLFFFIACFSFVFFLFSIGD